MLSGLGRSSPCAVEISRDYVRPHPARRAKRAERQDLGHDDDEERTGFVADPRELGIITDLAKKVGVLHDDAGRVTTDQPGEVLSAARRRSLGGHLEADKPRIGLAHLALMRMETAR